MDDMEYQLIITPNPGSGYKVTTYDNVMSHMISGNFLIITIQKVVIDGETDKPKLSTTTLIDDLSYIKSFEQIIKTKKY